MKRLVVLFWILMPLRSICQQDSIIAITVGNVSFNMVRIESAEYVHRNYYGDTICNYYMLSSIKDYDAYNGECKIILSSYYIGQCEVTQELYRAVMGTNPSYYNPIQYRNVTLQHPVETVSWYDADAFVKALSQLSGKKFRLPTESEWEYAASCGDTSQVYSGGDTIEEVAWGWDNGEQRSHPVAQKKPNQFGLFDMSGNITEWCSDWFSSDYYLPNRVYRNPKGPSKGTLKVRKGGSWDNEDRFLKPTTRVGYPPKQRGNGCGFRLAMDAEDVKR